MKLFEYIDSMNQPYDIFCTDNVHSPLHWHYYSEILYIYSGSILIECNNKSMILKKGDLCYFYPLQLHSVKPDPSCDEAVNYAVIKFNIQTLSIPKAYLQTMYDSFVHRNSDEDFCLLVHQDEKIPSIVKNILDEYECKELMHMLAVQSGIYIATQKNQNRTCPFITSWNILMHTLQNRSRSRHLQTCVI